MVAKKNISTNTEARRALQQKILESVQVQKIFEVSDLSYIHNLGYDYTNNLLSYNQSSFFEPMIVDETYTEIIYTKEGGTDQYWFCIASDLPTQWYAIGFKDGQYRRIVRFYNNGVSYEEMYADDGTITGLVSDGDEIHVIKKTDRLSFYVNNVLGYELLFEDFPLVDFSGGIGFVNNSGKSNTKVASDIRLLNTDYLELSRAIHQSSLSYDFENQKIVVKDNRKKYVKVLLMGDSITDATKFEWKDKFIELTGIDENNIVNTAVIGATYEYGQSTTDSLVYKSQSVDSIYDLVVIFAGTNDWAHNATLNDTWESDPATYDYTTTNFKQAVNNTLHAVIAANPTAKILVCTPIQRYLGQVSESIADGKHEANTNGDLLLDYVNAIKEVSDYYGVNVVDLWKESGICFENYSTYTSDGLHPNSDGGNLIGEVIGKKVNQIFD